MKRLTLFLSATGLALAALVVPGPAADAATPRCQGQPATIVGGPDQDKIKCTNGPDVIISNKAWKVSGRGGDDLICVTSSTISSIAAGARTGPTVSPGPTPATRRRR